MKKLVSKLISVCPSGGCTSSRACGQSSRSISRRTMAGVIVARPATSAGSRQTIPRLLEAPVASVVRMRTYQVPGRPRLRAADPFVPGAVVSYLAPRLEAVRVAVRGCGGVEATHLVRRSCGTSAGRTASPKLPSQCRCMACGAAASAASDKSGDEQHQPATSCDVESSATRRPPRSYRAFGTRDPSGKRLRLQRRRSRGRRACADEPHLVRSMVPREHRRSSASKTPSVRADESAVRVDSRQRDRPSLAQASHHSETARKPAVSPEFCISELSSPTPR